MEQTRFKADILIVDDTPANVHLLADILKKNGYKVRPASNGVRALAVARLKPPDIILLDILMPGMNGYEVCHHLKADERTANVPIIFLSALSETRNKLKAFEVGGVDYITKPFRAKEVLARVQTHLDLRQTQEALQQKNKRLQEEIVHRKEAEETLRAVNWELEQSLTDMATVNLIAQTVATIDNLETILQQVAREIVAVFSAYSSAIMLIDSERTQVNVVAGYTTVQLETNLVGQQIPIMGHSINERLFRDKETLIIPNVQTNPLTQPIHDLMVKLNIQTMMIVPLVVRGEIIGWFSVESDQVDRLFTDLDKDLGETIASQIATAIESARLFKEEQTAKEALAQTLQKLQTAQQELILSEKMAVLGQLVAGIAHEINTPLAAIRASADNTVGSLNETINQLPMLFQKLPPTRYNDFMTLLNQSLQNKIVLTRREIRKKKRALCNVLEMAEFEQADIVAELLVDMGIYEDITEFMPLLREPNVVFVLQMADGLAGLQKEAQNIMDAVKRASKIVFALKSYTHHDHRGERIIADIPHSLDTVLTLYHNQLSHGVELTRQYHDVPPILCYPDELSQVWINLIHNAIYAMSGKGNLVITIEQIQPNQVTLNTTPLPTNYIRVSITDNGHGVPQDIQTRIFEPFFTTKPIGEGSGLGLDISRKIMAKHNGDITLVSQPGCTTFKAWLPIKTEQQNDK